MGGGWIGARSRGEGVGESWGMDRSEVEGERGELRGGGWGKGREVETDILQVDRGQ